MKKNKERFVNKELTDDVKNKIKLMAIITAWEQWTTGQEFSKDTADSPDIDSLLQKATTPKKKKMDQDHNVSIFSSLLNLNTALTLVYILKDNMISGARYHRVATYSVIKPASLPPGFVERVLRARPKSHTFKSQLAFRSRFAGFRSRWTMSAECIVFSARSVWYTKYCEREEGWR